MNTMTRIDWAMLGEAIAFYEGLGYRYIETPWLVPDEISRITFDAEGLACQAGTLVGSAEQGFLALDVGDDAKLVSCSPCFRNEPVLNELYQTWFMKVELYWSGNHVEEIVTDAENFLNRFVPCSRELTPYGVDLTAMGIEVGSYGERVTHHRHWTYGTGLALPRTSIAMKRYAISNTDQHRDQG